MEKGRSRSFYLQIFQFHECFDKFCDGENNKNRWKSPERNTLLLNNFQDRISWNKWSELFRLISCNVIETLDRFSQGWLVQMSVYDNSWQAQSNAYCTQKPYHYHWIFQLQCFKFWMIIGKKTQPWINMYQERLKYHIQERLKRHDYKHNCHHNIV